MTGFYVVKPKGILFGTKWAYGEIVPPQNVGEAARCPVCLSAVELRRWMPPHLLRLSSAKSEKWGDFVWGAGFPLLVSERFKRIYEKEGLTGIEPPWIPVEIVKAGRKPIKAVDSSPTYYLIHVPWGGANQNDEASRVRFEYEDPKRVKCDYCGGTGQLFRKQEGVIIDPASWNGEDIFRPRRAPVSFMVSERFKEIAEQYQLTNVVFIPAEKYGYDEHRPGIWYVIDH